jgi:hypothetical protein
MESPQVNILTQNYKVKAFKKNLESWKKKTERNIFHVSTFETS